jgi:uncharacterized protein YcbK (DUF882 family)
MGVIKWFSRFGAKPSITIPLPSFHKEEMEQSKPSKFDDDKGKKLPEVKKSTCKSLADPLLNKKLDKVIKEYEKKYPGRKVKRICVFRHPKRQKQLHRKGRFGDNGPIVTTKDGYEKKSKHNVVPCMATDVAIYIKGMLIWHTQDEKIYYPLGPLCNKHGLCWGGFWTKPFDPYHVELKQEDTQWAG